MSIINDALEKAKKAPREQEIFSVNPQSPGVSVKKWPVFLSVSLILLVSVIGALFLYNSMARSGSIGYSSPPNLSDMRSAVDTEMSKVSRSMKVDKAYQLNGIMCDDEGKWAIVNDKVVKEGDAVSGGEITGITSEFVKIQKNDGNEIVLNLK